MTRVIAGHARGRSLAVPPGRDTRPTSDRTREALFSAVESLLGPLHGLRVLDLYAGSGAIGLEALSRGAAHALLVESAPRAVRALRANIAALAADGAELRAEPVERVVAAGPAGPPYDLVFLDPPYRLETANLRAVVADVCSRGWLRPGAAVVVERATRDAWSWPGGVEAGRERRYGETTLWYGRAVQAGRPVSPDL